MTSIFSAVVSPNARLLNDISALAPQSPFDTPEYAAALSAGGALPCALFLQKNQKINGGCLAALVGSKWNRQLNIFSAPHVESPATFWKGVAGFCRSQRVCDLDVGTFAAISPDMPQFDNVVSERARSEFIVKLSDDDRVTSYSKNHKRSISKAVRASLKLARSSALDDYTMHIQMMHESMTRRAGRGEAVPMPSEQDIDHNLLLSGAGELFQATLDGRIIASILILKSDNSGYYHSAGTSPEGMKLGASPFLINEVSKTLAESGFQSFNLGGVDPGADGLRRFKSGFGAEEIQLKAASYSMISPSGRAVRSIARRAKSKAADFVRAIRR